MNEEVCTEKQARDIFEEKLKDVKTKQDLMDYMDFIENYEHDYGTIVIGMAFVMRAAFEVMDESKCGGITGFQAGCLGWEMVKEFMDVEGPARLLDFNKMLFPQYEDRFDKTISNSTWEHIQEEAKKKLSEDGLSVGRVKGHWESIVEGNVPFGYVVKGE